MTTAASSSRASSPSGLERSLETQSPPATCAPSAHRCCSPQLLAPRHPQSWCPVASPAQSSWYLARVPAPSRAAWRGRGPVQTPTPEDIPEDTSEDTLEDTPEDTPEDIPEDTLEDIPEDP